MINEPWITVSCDRCGYMTDPMELCSIARGGWDTRYIKDTLREWGWRVSDLGGETICETCVELEQEETK